jgi:O-antigen ligase
MKRVMTELNKPQREEGIFTWLHGAVGIICIVIVVLGVINVRRLVADDESVVVRGQLNGAAIQIVRLSPLLGVGLGNFLVKLPGVLPSRTIYFLQPVHNIYLLLLAETGVIGLTFFLTAVAYTVCKHMHSIVTVSLLALLVLGLVDHYLFTLQQGQLLLATLIGLSFSDIHQSSS